MQQSVSDQGLACLYDELARFQWWRTRLAQSPVGAGLEMHKRLNAPRPGVDGPPAGVAGLDEWLATRIGAGEDPHAPARVLDVGCGFGATAFHWARRASDTSLVGLTLSPYQVMRAEETARALGLDQRCEFRRQSFDEPIEGSYDTIVSVEALFHARELAPTVANLGRALAIGGRLALVEDMALVTGLEDDASGERLLRCWHTERLHGAEDYLSALRAAGLELVYEHDLSEQVPREPITRLDRRRRRLERLRRLMPLAAGRIVADAFLGGIALQELYARHRMSYRVMIARRVRA